jgi:predicted PurR-regulated permease PerM
MPDELKHLNKEDLFLLMESYRNMITMHSTVVEQQKQIIDLQNNIISKQDNISTTQSHTKEQMKVITDKMNSWTSKLADSQKELQAAHIDMEKALTQSIDKVKEKLGDEKLDLTKQHSGINTRIYVSMGAMATIIIGLIALAMGLVDRYDMMQDMSEAIQEILNIVKNHTHP